MAHSTTGIPGRIFISYRRQDSSGVASRLYDRLADHFGDDQVVMDVDTIALGVDFAEVIIQAVTTSEVLVAVIGPHWLTASDEEGQRRLDDPDDIVRLEIAAALERDIRVIPVLVEGAVMPSRQELPASLAGLVRRNALSLRHESFHRDSERLVIAIKRVLDVGSPAAAKVRRQIEELARREAELEAQQVDMQALQAQLEARLEAEMQARLEAEMQARQAASDRRTRRGWLVRHLRRWSQAERSRPAEPTRERVRRGQPEPENEVSFTAGYPGVVTPQVWYSLSVYAHLGRLQAEVDKLIVDGSRQFGLRPAVSRAAAFLPLRRGTQYRISPEVQGVVFNPPVQEVRWLEDLQQVTFRLQATSNVAGHAVLGAVEVCAGPLLVAQVPLSIHVRGGGERQERAEAMTGSTARLFSSVFASYAHEDDVVVRAFAEAYRALGVDMLVDKTSLHAGEGWQQALLRLIEEADLFQLFWSEASSRSRAVAEEWQHALSLQDRKGERFIRPMYWQSPWPPPPPQLAHLHFASFDLAAVSSFARRT